MAIPILNHMDFGIGTNKAEIRNVRIHNVAQGSVSNAGVGQIIYDSGTLKYYNGSEWVSLGTSNATGDMTGVDISVGTGLDITQSNTTSGNYSSTISIDISEFSAVTPASGDSFLTLDSDGATEQLTTVSALQSYMQSNLTFTTNTNLSQEQVEDFVGGMLDGTETGISVSYDDTDGNIDFVVADSDFALTGDVTASGTQTAKGNLSIATTIASGAVHHAMLSDDIISGQGALTSGLVSTDELMISDAGTVKRMDVSVLQSYLQSNLTFTTNTNTQLSDEQVQDIVGAMVTGNTESGITVAYQDGDGTLDFTVGTLNQDTTGTASLAVVTDSNANTNFPVVFHNESNGLLDDTGALRYNPSTGTLLVPNLNVAGTTTQVDTVTMQAQNAIVFEGATADAHETTLTITDPTADRTITLQNDSGTLAFTSDITGTNSGTNTGDQLVFKNVASDSGTAVADTTTDTLTIAGGTNVTTSVSGDTLTITATDTNTQLSTEQVQDIVGQMVQSNTETNVSATYQDSDGTIDFEVANTNVAGDSGSTGISPGDTLTIAGGTNVTTAMSGDTLTITASDTNTQLSFASAAEVQAGTNTTKAINPDKLAAKSVHATIDVSDSTFASNLYAEITHSLGTEDVIVQLFDSSSKETVFADVARTDKSNSASTSKVKITFAAAPSNDIEVLITSIKGSTAGSVAYA